MYFYVIFFLLDRFNNTKNNILQQKIILSLPNTSRGFFGTYRGPMRAILTKWRGVKMIKY